jgi:hypothetical protein
MGKIGLNVVLLITLVLVGLYAWRSKRREAWIQAQRCYACGAAPSTRDKVGHLCGDCVQTRTIQRWLAGFMALVVGGIAAWWHGPF